VHSLSFYNRKKRHEPKKVWIELIDKYCNYRTMNIYYGTTHALSIYLYIYIYGRDTFSESLSVLCLLAFSKRMDRATWHSLVVQLGVAGSQSSGSFGG